MVNHFGVFAAFLMLQLFYAFSVSLIVPVLPAALDNQVVMFTNSAGVIEYKTLASEVEGTVDDQVNIPLLDFGALVFYSSSFLLNLMVNFITAIPQILTMFLQGVFIFFPFSESLQIQIKTIFTLIVSLFYFIGLIAFISNFRSGGVA